MRRRRFRERRSSVGLIARQFRIHQIDTERTLPDALPYLRNIRGDPIRRLTRCAENGKPPAFGQRNRNLNRMREAKDRKPDSQLLTEWRPQRHRCHYFDPDDEAFTTAVSFS
jgi:hypothetical protein